MGPTAGIPRITSLQFSPDNFGTHGDKMDPIKIPAEPESFREVFQLTFYFFDILDDNTDMGELPG
jgi:hypothetical protein